ncbi:MAG: cyclic pyranopterin monophosphate synthase MoaC [Planctomycetota bacterium]
MNEFTHFDKNGHVRMVDVGAKPTTSRMATASGIIEMQSETLDQIKNGQIKKGDVLEVARIAGIMATKKTADLIPLCHNISLNSVTINFEIIEPTAIQVHVNVSATEKTGVEMEALSGVSAALLTVYDMCKSRDRAMLIRSIQLDRKSGGKSGEFKRNQD